MFDKDAWICDMPIQRAVDEGEDLVIYGLASTGDVDRIGTRIDQDSLATAMRKYVKRGGKVFFNHNWNIPIGRALGTHHVKEEGNYLRAAIGAGYSVSMPYSGAIPVDDFRTMIRQGILSDYSVSFNGGPDPEDKKGERILVRDLYEVSVVSVPGNADANFAVSRAISSFPWGLMASDATRSSGGVWLLDDPAAEPAEEEEGQSVDINFDAVMEELRRCRQ